MTTPSRALSPADWTSIAAGAPAFIALWADTQAAHALYLDEATGAVLPVHVAVEHGRYPALSPQRPAAALFERMVGDLWGHTAAGAHPHRAWLDHGRFGQTHPMAARPGPAPPGTPEPPDFLPADGDDLSQVGLGPIHDGIIEPGHFRLTASGETIVRLEARLGYAHKGILSLMRGKPPRAAARFAARLSGDSTVAHGIAFARAAEDATDCPAPPRAHALRAAMGEIERVANHLLDIGATCGAAGLALLLAPTGRLREGLLAACAAAFGHRLMMDCVIPGGVAADLAADGARALLATLAEIQAAWPSLLAAYRDCASLADRVCGTGTILPAAAHAYAADGVVGRASGQLRDARRMPGYPPFDGLEMRPATREAGDVDARIRIRFDDLAESLQLLRPLLGDLPPGPVSLALPAGTGEGVGMAEGFRGACWAWLRLEGGQIAQAFMRDPSWTAWPLLEIAMADTTVSDFPLVNRSLGASYSGVDL